MTVHFVHQLEDLRRRSLSMVHLVQDMLEEACDAVQNTDAALAVRVESRDKDVDAAEVEIESEIVRLMALYQPVGSDLRLLCTLLKVNNDLERIADCSVNIAKRARYLENTGVVEHISDLDQLGRKTREILQRATSSFTAEDAELARKVLSEDQTVDDLHVAVVREVIAKASVDAERMASYVDILSVAKNMERIADHATNIAEDVIFLATGDIVRHPGLRERPST